MISAVLKISQIVLFTLLAFHYGYAQEKSEWGIGSLTEAGMDSMKVVEMEARVYDRTFRNIHGVLIVKNQKLVYEMYFQGHKYDYLAEGLKGEFVQFDKETVHNTASATKSVVSLLVGQAIGQGFISDSDAKIFSFFPQYAEHSDSLKSRITVGHLLTMTSGLKWNEQDVFYSEAENDIIQLFVVPDPIEFVLSKPAVHEPGTSFYYNGGGTNLLGEIIHQSSQLKLDEFAAKQLFNPLGIEGQEWGSINANITYADIKLRPRDMAKIGQLVLDEGKWKGTQIVPAKWIAEMTQPHTMFTERSGYARHWWIQSYAVGSENVLAVYADGWGGQRIMVFPTLDMVVVFTGGNYLSPHPLDEIISKYILPSLH